VLDGTAPGDNDPELVCDDALVMVEVAVDMVDGDTQLRSPCNSTVAKLPPSSLT